MMKKDCNIRWRFVGRKNSWRVVDAIGVRQRIGVGEILEIESSNDRIEILRLAHRQTSNQNGSMLKSRFG